MEEPLEPHEPIAACRQALFDVFPDICPKYLDEFAQEHGWDQHKLIMELLDRAEKGVSYPKRSRSRKRKREDTPDEEPEPKFDLPVLRQQARQDFGYLPTYIKVTKILLKQTFPQAYAQDVELVVKEHDNALFASYLALDKEFMSDEGKSRFRTKKMPGKIAHNPDLSSIPNVGLGATHALDEYKVAKRHCEASAAKRSFEKQQKEFEYLNLEQARSNGTIAECQCCFDDLPLNRMVHCDSEESIHFFCYACARTMAETEIGMSKCKLTCMSMEQCHAGFSLEQRKLFLDEKLLIALERIETEANLRMAGIENLETCPFCPYAAEYPPAEENKEFRCDNPDCELVSCRLCRQETHIPVTCEEAAREMGHSSRRIIEEAMSAALIRKCNKCQTPFIKEHGCNKMVCSRPGCSNIQCYVCSKSCDYAHFDDRSRGGKQGNCPLFDNVETRHENEVRAAEEAAREAVKQENPDVDPSIFEIQVSDRVKQDEERRKGIHPPGSYPNHIRPPAIPLPRPPQRHPLAIPVAAVPIAHPVALPFVPLPPVMLHPRPPPPPPPPNIPNPIHMKMVLANEMNMAAERAELEHQADVMFQHLHAFRRQVHREPPVLQYREKKKQHKDIIDLTLDE